MNDERPWQGQADDWLQLVDALDAHASWQAAAESFRSAVTPDEWAEQLLSVRKPLGARTSRTLAVEERATDLPGGARPSPRELSNRPSYSFVSIQFFPTPMSTTNGTDNSAACSISCFTSV